MSAVRRRWLTLPNALTALRAAGTVPLLMLAATGRAEAFAWLFLVLAMTDWVDGKLAVWLDQRSPLGARLDSWADVALYAALLAGALLLDADALVAVSPWFAPAIGSYALSVAGSYYRFRRWPAYHTRAAKTCWLLVTLSAPCFLAGWAVWPLQATAVLVTLTNVEAVVLTCLLSRPRSDIASVLTLLAERRRG